MRIPMKVLAVGLFAALAPAMASAQQTTAAPAAAPVKLETGTWTGVVSPPNGETVNVTYDVVTRNDTLSININAGQFGAFPAQAVKLEAAKLSFSFTPGPTVQCVLTKQADLSYTGDCLDDGGGVAHMTMVPPKKATTGT